MNDIELKIEALRRCVPEKKYEQALADLKATNPCSASDSQTLHDIIYRVLQDLAIPAHIRGYAYIVRGLELSVDDPDIVHAITSELYPEIAMTFQTTPSRVERAIRHAIEVGWDRGDLEVEDAYFGNTVSPTRGKPTNCEFFAQISGYIRRQFKANKIY